MGTCGYINLDEKRWDIFYQIKESVKINACIYAS
jgi:hypothetical protein